MTSELGCLEPGAWKKGAATTGTTQQLTHHIIHSTQHTQQQGESHKPAHKQRQMLSTAADHLPGGPVFVHGT